MKIKVLSLPFVFLSIALLEFDRQSLSSNVIAILDPTSGLLTLFTKKCKMLDCNVAMKVANKKKGIFSFHSYNMKKKFH